MRQKNTLALALPFSLSLSLLFAPSLAASQTCDEQFARVQNVLSAREQKALDKIRKEAGKYFAANLRLPEDGTAQQLQMILQGETTAVRPITVEEIVLREPQATQTARGKVVAAYMKIVRTYQRIPDNKELAEALGIKEVELAALLGDGGSLHTGQRTHVGLFKSPRKKEEREDRGHARLHANDGT